MSIANYGTFQDLLDISPEALRPAMQKMRTIIFTVYPEVFEVVRLEEKSATYGIGPKKNSEAFVYILPYKNWFNLGFMYGADLPDPKSLLEGTGKKLRHIKIKSIDECESDDIKVLIKAALNERLNSRGKKAFNI